MPHYLISYDLTKTERDYEGVHSTIEGFGRAARVLESTWIVESDVGIDQMRGKLLRDDAENNDRFLIVSVEGPWLGVRLRTDEFLKLWLGPPQS
jgi:hypothetical protein